jgi:hypothetical protein
MSVRSPLLFKNSVFHVRIGHAVKGVAVFTYVTVILHHHHRPFHLTVSLSASMLIEELIGGDIEALCAS